MISFLSCRKKAITVIELIIALAIFSLVIGGAFSIYSFSNKTYSNGVKQSDIQSNIRLAEDYIAQQIRFASEVNIKGNGFSIPSQSTIDPYQNYIYIEKNAKDEYFIIHLNKYNKKSIPIGKNGVLNFVSIEPFNDIKYSIESTAGSQKYNINSEITPLNLHLGVGRIEGNALILDPADTFETIKGVIIYFKTAGDFITENLKPIVTIGSENNKDKLVIEFDRVIDSVTILPNPNVQSISKTLSENVVTFQISFNGSNKNPDFKFRVTFGLGDAYGNTYDYHAYYEKDKGQGIWIIE